MKSDIQLSNAVLVTIIICLLFFIIFILSRVKTLEHINKTEGITLFGVKMTTTDYFSFISTCIAYMLSDFTGDFNLHDFINPTRIDDPKYKDDFYKIEKTINQFPIVHCIYMDNGKYVIDKDKMGEKMGKYQKMTKGDSYIIPLFDLSLIGRNQELFSFATIYQQSKVLENVMKTVGLDQYFEEGDKVIEDAQSLTENTEEKKMKPLVVRRVFTSERNTTVPSLNVTVAN